MRVIFILLATFVLSDEIYNMFFYIIKIAVSL